MARTRSGDRSGGARQTAVAIWLARIMPAALAYWIVRRVAWMTRKRRTHPYTIFRENLAHVVPDRTPSELDDLAEEAVRQLGYVYFDMFHFRERDLLSGRLLEYDPVEWERAQAAFASPMGTIVVGAHISNYDLAAQWFVSNGNELQALSLPEPGGGTQVVNQARRSRGLIVTPISVHALREAMRRLRAGGTIITGVDRPADYNDAPITFFGAPAPLPRGHIRLALQTGARIMVANCARKPHGGYRLYCGPPMEMETTDDREADIERNALRVLEQVEESIRRSPEQWGMLHPVWRAPQEPTT